LVEQKNKANDFVLTFTDLRKKLRLVLGPESSFYAVSIVYGLGVSLLTLAIPISVQSLVNTVSSNVLLQPLVVLSLVLLSLLCFSGVLKAFQAFIIEKFQRRFYSRIASEITVKVLNSNYSQIDESNAVELVNRYFDVMTIQKSVAKLVTSGISLALQTVVGLLLLAFYHPYFLVFDLLLILLISLVWRIYGKGALKTAIYESKSKYKVGSWLEELARVNLHFKTTNRKNAAIEKSEVLIKDYLTKRGSHFRKLFAQKVFLLVIYAFMSALVLGLGGFLVIKGELSLGQLVAAELIVTVILSGLSGSGRYLESFYDLYAAVDKISVFNELLPETDLPDTPDALLDKEDFCFSGVEFAFSRYNLKYDFTFKKGKTYIIDSKVYSSKQVFINLSQAFLKPQSGYIDICGLRSLVSSPNSIRQNIQVVAKPVTFDGTLRENICFGNSNVTDNQIVDAFKKTFLLESYSSFDDGLDTRILPSGHPLWSTQLLRIELVRALVNEPKVLILTEIFDQIEDYRLKSMIEELQKTDIIIIYITNKNLNLLDTEERLVLNNTGLSLCDGDLS
jgi:putative ABC transport system ATP-binding protein